MKDIIKIYGLNVMKYFAVAFFIVFGILFLTTYPFMGTVSSVTAGFLTVFVLAFSLASSFIGFFGFAVLKKLYADRSGFFMQIPVSSEKRFLAIVLANLFIHAMLNLLIIAVSSYIDANISKIAVLADISFSVILSQMLIAVVLPLFVMLTAKVVFPRFNEWLLFVLLNMSVSGFNNWLGSFSEYVLVFANLVLALFIGIIAYSSIKYTKTSFKFPLAKGM